jgi:hypothetical protein
MQQLTIQQLKMMRESEDHVEFKKGEGGNVQYDGSNKNKASDRRRCILGYVVALCNEGGGNLVIGMHDQYPHQVIGTTQAKDAVGQLESDIYRDVGIRPHVYELYEGDKRVLVINVPGRPVGKVFKFEDVPLMRVGEELRPMDDKTYLSIIQEQEPDFSQKICECATIADLDAEAIAIMKRQYARKQNNPAFVSISDVQALSDLSLIQGEKVTNAAVLLVGKEEFIHRVYPQAKVMLEYRNTEGQINFDIRKVFGQPFFKMIDLFFITCTELMSGVFKLITKPYSSVSVPATTEVSFSNYKFILWYCTASYEVWYNILLIQLRRCNWLFRNVIVCKRFHCLKMIDHHFLLMFFIISGLFFQFVYNLFLIHSANIGVNLGTATHDLEKHIAALKGSVEAGNIENVKSITKILERLVANYSSIILKTSPSKNNIS